jgi:hypothetical protein
LEGRLRVGYTRGSFSKYQTLDVLVPQWIDRHYEVYSARLSYGPGQRLSTELSQGRYWNRDEGATLTQRFWFGDTSLALYVRQTKKPEDPKPVSFAGIQLSLPLTPRQSIGWSHLGLRGTKQWSYAVESRILNKENFITGGYGSLPATGETLQQLYNRDRFGSAALQGEIGRLRDAHLSMTD